MRERRSSKLGDKDAEGDSSLTRRRKKRSESVGTRRSLERDLPTGLVRMMEMQVLLPSSLSVGVTATTVGRGLPLIRSRVGSASPLSYTGGLDCVLIVWPLSL